MDRGAWQAAVHGVAKELDMTEQLNNNIELVTILLLFYVMASSQVGSELPDQGLNLHPLLWKAKSKPLDHQGSPGILFLIV